MSLLILIAEDEPVLRELLTDLMVDEGYRVVTARNGVEALQLAGLQSPDLVISDIAMPRLDGLELVQRLREQGVQVPVILISGHAARPDLPGVRFVRKPFDLEALIEEVAAALSRAPGAALQDEVM